jgi:hypothetical protein
MREAHTFVTTRNLRIEDMELQYSLHTESLSERLPEPFK